MNLSDAKLVGQSYTDEKTGVTFWMHPALPMRFFAARDYFVEQGLSPTEPIIDAFITADACTLCIESERNDLSLQRYLEMRVGKTVGERYELFLTLVNAEYAVIINAAYHATRKEEFPSDIPPEIASDNDLKKSTSRTSLGKRSKRKQKPVTNETNAIKSTTMEAAS